jgi:hypothetical protein
MTSKEYVRTLTVKFEVLSNLLYGGTCIPIMQVVLTGIRIYTGFIIVIQLLQAVTFSTASPTLTLVGRNISVLYNDSVHTAQ